jgi:hypothetical protein
MAINYTGKSKVIKRLCETVNQLITAEDALSKFDADGDGIVDNAARVNGHTVKSDVPEGAVFTDTTYTFELSDGKLIIRSSAGAEQVLTLSKGGGDNA